MIFTFKTIVKDPANRRMMVSGPKMVEVSHTLAESYLLIVHSGQYLTAVHLQDDCEGSSQQQNDGGRSENGGDKHHALVEHEDGGEVVVDAHCAAPATDEVNQVGESGRPPASDNPHGNIIAKVIVIVIISIINIIFAIVRFIHLQRAVVVALSSLEKVGVFIPARTFFFFCKWRLARTH